MVGGQIKHSLGAREFALPIFNFPGEHLAAHVVALPLCVLRVLQKKFGKLRLFVLRNELVTLRHFAEKNRDRPTVSDNVMHHQDKEMCLWIQAEQDWPDQWPFPQVEGSRSLFCCDAQSL